VGQVNWVDVSWSSEPSANQVHLAQTPLPIRIELAIGGAVISDPSTGAFDPYSAWTPIYEN
jgi:hypothetical protein